jgi:hypothetical protein
MFSRCQKFFEGLPSPSLLLIAIFIRSNVIAFARKEVNQFLQIRFKIKVFYIVNSIHIHIY